MKNKWWKRSVSAVLAGMLLAGMLAGCGEKESNSGEGGMQKVRVEVFDRNNAPEGQGSAVDNKWTKWIQEEAAKAGLEVEYEACPRAQEKEKLNVWMASNSAPDIVFTYDYNTVAGYAQQNGIYELTESIDKYGAAIKEKLADVLEFGQFEGKQYAIPGRTVPPSVGPLKIRKDWLDKLNMEIPTNIDELYTVLKAFKEQDPGGVGKENVVPFAIPAPGVVGQPGFYLDLMFPFGVRNDVYGSFPCLPSGNYENGEFHSPVDLPEAKEFYRWMNKLYQEGLIHKEFVVDNNGSRYTQHVSSGVAGFVNCNDIEINPLTKDAVPTVDWAVMEPLADANGEKQLILSSPARWYNFVPKSSESPDAAVKFINWMVENKVDVTLYNGFEGDHYTMDGDLIVPKDKEYTRNDLEWVGNDLNLIGSVNYQTPEDKLDKVYTGETGAKQIKGFEMAKQYGKQAMVLSAARPVAQDKMSTLQKYVFEGAAKVIVASDFEAEYENYVNGWKQLGGDQYDQEIADIIKAQQQ